MPDRLADLIQSNYRDLSGQMTAITDAAADEGRTVLTTEETASFQALSDQREAMRPRLEQLATEAEREASVAHLFPAREREVTGVLVSADGFTPLADTTDAPESPYTRFAQYARDVIITRFDAIGQRVGQEARREAGKRLERAVAAGSHITTADVPGLLPPQYVSDLIGLIDANRPLVEASRKLTLTAGKLQYPKVTLKPIVGKQTAEKTDLPAGPMTIVLEEAVAETFGGAGNLSWQAINWSTPDALALWFDLVGEAYAAQTELAAGVALQAVAGTPIVVAEATLEAWMAAIAQAAAAIYTASGKRPNAIALDVASGYNLLGLVGSTAPVFFTAGTGNIATGTGVVAGLKLIISPALPAQYGAVGDFSQLLTAETAGAPVELRAVEPSIAGMEVGVVGAFLAKVVDPGAFVELTAPTPPIGFAASASASKAKS